MLCPLCGHEFGEDEINRHVNDCMDGNLIPVEAQFATKRIKAFESSSAGVYANDDFDGRRKTPAPRFASSMIVEEAVEEDDDEKFARQLQQEEDRMASSQSSGFPCMLCQQTFPIESLYLLDACTHKFCRPCLCSYIQAQLEEMISSEIGCPVCSVVVSIRDLQDFTRHSSTSPRKESRLTAGMDKVQGTARASKRIMKELTGLAREKTGCVGISAEPIESNLYEWEVRLFGFDPDSTDPAEAAFAQDLDKSPRSKEVVLRVAFPSSYPQNPPFIRVVRPRFQFRTGHITIGGSICTEELTSSGWDPSLTVESVLLSIRTNMISGGARLDHRTAIDYSEAEAKEAFERTRIAHGWL